MNTTRISGPPPQPGLRVRAARLLLPLAVLYVSLGLPSCVQASAHPGDWRPIPVSILPAGLASLMPVAADNPLTWAKIELGRDLFFDPRLSRDGSISCATCHLPDKAFADGNALALGIDQRRGRRNVPSLLNAAYAKSMFWDGRTISLEEQALLPLTSPDEMDNTLQSVLAMIANDERYRRQFEAAFETRSVRPEHVAKALASYQRTLVSGNSPYDQYEMWKQSSLLSDAERRGLDIFRNKARCAFCHDGPLFTDQRFHNTGVSWGKEPADFGRSEHTRRPEDKGKFKTPSLRNLVLTAPYMHDGSMATLEEVIEFYDRGAGPNPNLDGIIRPLRLTVEEKSDLLQFLHSLSPGGAERRAPRGLARRVEPPWLLMSREGPENDWNPGR